MLNDGLPVVTLTGVETGKTNLPSRHVWTQFGRVYTRLIRPCLIRRSSDTLRA